jgi:hypothetical protein
VTDCAHEPLAELDAILLQLLRLAAEAILTHPEAVPAGLYEQIEDWADDLAVAVNGPAATSPQPPPGPSASSARAALVAGRDAVTAGREPRP